MAGVFGDVGPEFGLRDAKIGVWVGDGTYTGTVDVPSVQMYEVNPQTVNATLTGDDKETDVHAIAISAQVRIRFGSVAFAVLQVLTGKQSADSPGGDPTAHTLTFDNFKFPYFGIVGKALETQGNGDTHIFVPKCKIMEGFTLPMQYGQYVIPEITCKAVLDDVYNAILMIVKHETEDDATLPPTFSS